MKPQRWAGEDGSLLACGPGEPLAIVDIYCASCRARHRGERTWLGAVAVSTKPGADRGNLWVRGKLVSGGLDEPATLHGVPVTIHDIWGYPRWRGEGESRRLLLLCGWKAKRPGCGSAPQPCRSGLLDEIVLTRATLGSRVARPIWR